MQLGAGSDRTWSAIYGLRDQSLEFSECLRGGNHACLAHCLNVMGPVFTAEPENGRSSRNTGKCRQRQSSPSHASLTWVPLQGLPRGPSH